MRSFLLYVSLLALLLASSRAFSPAVHQQLQLARTSATAASSSTALNDASSSSSFDDYSPTDPDQDLASQDTVVGTGEVVAAEGSFVTVAYKGRLLSNNKVFDENLSRGISFRIGDKKVISGWERGIVGMRVGGKRTLKIPPSLAYGDRGAGAVIPPRAHLVFDCELKSIAGSQLEETAAEVMSMNPFNLLAFALIFGNVIMFVAGNGNN